MPQSARWPWLCQQVATRANHEDQEVGKFWQARFRAVRLLDEPGAAGLLRLCRSEPDSSRPGRDAGDERLHLRLTDTERVVSAAAPDGFLSPLELDERSGELGAVPSQGGQRCSDKGFLPISAGDYLILLDWTARQSVAGKRGTTPKALQPIFERLSLDRKIWCALVGSFGRLFYNVAGLPPTIDATFRAPQENCSQRRRTPRRRDGISRDKFN